MNAAQLRMYRAEWGKTRKWLRAHGLDPVQTDAKRHAIHRAELGRDKSSLALSNPELTKVLRAFKGIYDGGNLQAQLDANDEPERAAAELHQRIERLAAECGIQGETAGLERYFAHWFRGRDYVRLATRELQQLAGLLERRAKQLRPDDGDPF